jgi:hypothetical protein
MMFRIAALTALTLFLVPTVGTSQNDVGQGGHPDTGEKTDGKTDAKAAKGGIGKGGKVTAEDMKAGDEELAKLPLEERLERTKMRGGAHGYCRIEASVRPSRLMPGQTGTAVFTMILQADAVMPATAHLLFNPIGGPPNVVLGPMTVKPAKIAKNERLAKAYLGQPVYDNYAILTAPVTLATALPPNYKPQATVEITFDLYTGSTGAPIGRFIDVVNLPIEIGTSPDPVVQSGPQDPVEKNAVENGEHRQRESTPAPTHSEAGDATGNGAPEIAKPEVAERVSGDQLPGVGASGGGEPSVPVEGGVNLVLVGGGGLVLIVLAAALLRRR